MDTTKDTRREGQSRPRQEGSREGQRPQGQKAPPRQRPESAQPRREQAKSSSAVKQRPARAGSPSRSAKQEQSRTQSGQKQAPQRSKAKQPAQTRQKPRREAPDDLSAKRRAYGNSKPKKKSAFARMTESVGGAVAAAKARSAAKKSGTKRTNRPAQPAPAVIYTQPKAFNRTRLLVQMLSVAAVVAALVMSLSVFFKVKHITITGAQTYTPWAVEQASGIKKASEDTKGDNLFSFGHARAGAQIKAKLPYVKSVRVGIKLPDTVNIIIEEESVVYAIKDNTGTWWLMNASGRVVEMTNSSKAKNYTQILGVTLDNPAPNTMAVATEVQAAQPSQPADPTGEPVAVSTGGAQRLDAVKQILTALEANDIVGEAASVDVTRTEDIILWYGSRYQVNLGDTTDLEYKIACMNDVILQLGDYETGILDVSFTIWPEKNKVSYTPFE